MMADKANTAPAAATAVPTLKRRRTGAAKDEVAESTFAADLQVIEGILHPIYISLFGCGVQRRSGAAIGDRTGRLLHRCTCGGK